MPKERTKGQKEIDKNNADTIKYYLQISYVACAIHIVYVLIFSYFYSELQVWTIVWLIIAVVHHGGGQWMLSYLCKSGSDLETSWISEYSKDIIIFISILQVASGVSNKVWLLWLILPIFAFYKVWVTLLWPWFTAGSQPTEDIDSKKQKKSKVKKVYR